MAHYVFRSITSALHGARHVGLALSPHQPWTHRNAHGRRRYWRMAAWRFVA